MKKFAIFFFLIVSLSLFSLVEETGSFSAFIYGNDDNLAYDNFVSHIAEGIATANYNLYAPYDPQTSGFGDYRIPTSDDLDSLQVIFDLFVAGEFEAAELSLAETTFPYELVLFHDTDENRDLYILREYLNSDVDDNGTNTILDDEVGSFDYGWGLYVYNPNAEYPIVVTVPHPNDDFHTGAFGAFSFAQMDARYLLISGAGREVKWTNVTPYYNSKSLSDPSRNVNHPFSKFYNTACDEMRATYNTREFSLQLHSYDWNRHEGHAPLQISAGNGKPHVDLPIRDLSSRKFDLVNELDEVIIEANHIGIHDDVTVSNYLSVNYNDGDFHYFFAEEELDVPNKIDLPGYSQNKQMQKTLSGWNDNDRFEPFFHIEMDELPDVYPQTLNFYQWFYGYDVVEQAYVAENLYHNSIEFYSPWIIALRNSVQEYFDYDEQSIPTTPQSLVLSNNDFNQARLSWNRSDDYDFSSYQILYSTEPIENDNYEIFDRDNDSNLATINREYVDLTGLNPNQQYFFRIRAIDEEGNVSEMSNEVETTTGSAKILNYKALGYDGEVRISWLAQQQNNCAGFIIEKRLENGDFETISSYENNNSLVGSSTTNVTYEFVDTNVTNDISADYRLKAVSNTGSVSIHRLYHTVKPEKIYALYFYDPETTLSDTIYFGKNLQASDSWDADYDVESGSYTGDYVFAQFYEQYWQNHDELKTHIKSDFDSDNYYKEWTVKLKSNQIGHALEIGLANPDRNSEKIYLVKGSQYINLASETGTYTVPNSNDQTWTLRFGNLEPTIYFGNRDNEIFQVGEFVNFTWNYSHKALIEDYDLFFARGDEEWLIVEGQNTNTYSSNLELTEAYGSDLKIKAVAHLVNGDTEVFYSPYTVGIFPANIDWEISENRDMISVPFTEVNEDLNVLFGNYEIQQWVGNDFIPTMFLNSQFGYWIDPENPVAVTRDYSVNKLEVILGLPITGWQLMPNPHLCDYQKEQLFIEHNSERLTFNEAVQYNLIKPYIYIYENGYKKTNVIPATKSFWIETMVDGLILAFVPYNELDIAPNDEPSQVITLTASQNNEYDNIELVIADVDATLGYNIGKVPDKPFADFVKLSLANDTNDNLQQKLIPTFDAEAAETREINFNFVRNADIPTTFMINDNLDTEMYRYRLKINEEIHFLEKGVEYDIESIADDDMVSLLIHNEFVSNDAPAIANYSLKNYPNPFNPSTKIRFTIPKAGKAKISVYNIKGQLVKRLVNDEFSSGSHTIEWDGTNENSDGVSSGVYFYRLKHDKKTITRKMLLLK